MARTKRKVNPILSAETASSAPQQRIYRAGGYARLSVEDSGKSGTDTIETQRELLESYICDQPDLQLYRLYCDNGCTGTNFARPAFERMMEDVRAGKIDCIVVKDLSRFGRNYLETGNYLERFFPVLGIRFIAIHDYFDTLTAERSSDGYIIPLKNIINAVYSKDIYRKVSSALFIKRQNGEFIGSWAPYGYQKCAENPRRLEPNQETAPIVRNIFQWHSEGVSCRQIARELNRLEIPSPSRYLYQNGIVKTERYQAAACSCKNLHETQLTEVLWDTLQKEIALAGNLEKLMRQYTKSAAAIRQEEAEKREILSAQQTLNRSGMLYDSLYRNYVDRLMTKSEYMELKQKYRADMEQTKAWLAELERQRLHRRTIRSERQRGPRSICGDALALCGPEQRRSISAMRSRSAAMRWRRSVGRSARAFCAARAETGSTRREQLPARRPRRCSITS